jgi:hypothetical protein
LETKVTSVGFIALMYGIEDKGVHYDFIGGDDPLRQCVEDHAKRDYAFIGGDDPLRQCAEDHAKRGCWGIGRPDEEATDPTV